MAQPPVLADATRIPALTRLHPGYERNQLDTHASH
jgi:hypothetical protein